MDRPVGALLPDFNPPPAPGPAIIEGRTVRLERLDPARHAAALHEGFDGHPWVWDYLGYGPFPDAAAYAEWVARMAALADPFFYAFIDRTDGRAKGLGALMRIEPAHGCIEVGHINISPALQRSTAASEAIMAMVGWAFDAGYRRVEWKCDSLNAPSRRAAARYGFTFEGIFRQHMIIKGRNRDTAWFAITDADWPRIREAWARWLSPGNFDAEGRQRTPLDLR